MSRRDQGFATNVGEQRATFTYRQEPNNGRGRVRRVACLLRVILELIIEYAVRENTKKNNSIIYTSYILAEAIQAAEVYARTYDGEFEVVQIEMKILQIVYGKGGQIKWVSKNV